MSDADQATQDRALEDVLINVVKCQGLEQYRNCKEERAKKVRKRRSEALEIIRTQRVNNKLISFQK